ncbi:MAG: efflux RND transporter periplasmic adaptor subunit [Candidatus Brocadiaceae bacterium]|jgi:multidrug resistance efflux pump
MPTIGKLGILLMIAAFGAAVGSTEQAVGDPAPITAEGQAWVARQDRVVFGVETRHNFRATLAELIPEWSHVEEGQVIARLHTPLVPEEVALQEVLLREAEGELKRAEAEATAALAELESKLLAAQVEYEEAKAKLEAMRNMPSAEELTKLELELDETNLRIRHTRAHLELLRQLTSIGLCSETERRETEHELERLTHERERVEAALAELRAEPDSLEATMAELAAHNAELEVRIATLRRDSEAASRELECEATRLEKVAPARRALDLARRRRKAMTLRAPSAGYVEHGTEWRESRARVKLKEGRPVWFGQTVASIINLSEVRILARVEESRFFELAPGDHAEVRFRAVPGKTYHGAVERILPIVRAEGENFLEIDMEASERHGLVLVRLRNLDERVRPGMTADTSLFPGTGEGEAPARSPTEERPTRPADRPGADRSPSATLRGWLKAARTRFVRAPFAGRVTWAAEQGMLVRKGDLLVKLDPGLQEDWRSEIEDELRRRESRLKAAGLELELQKELAPLLKEAARAKVRLAEISLRQLQELPVKSERLSAQNRVEDAEWQLEEARDRLAAYLQLADKGLTSQPEVKRRKLQVASAEAGLEMARAELEEVRRGTPEPELALARAELELARVSARKAEVHAEAGIRAAAQKKEAAKANLSVYREKAERRRKKAQEARVTAPIDGILLHTPAEGQEIREGWWVALLADLTHSEVHAALDEPEYFRVQSGAPARVRLAGLPDRTYPARVTQVTDWQLPWWYWQGPEEKEVKRGKTFEVALEIEGDPPPCVGMSATVEVLPLRKRNAVGKGEGSPVEGRNTDGTTD